LKVNAKQRAFAEYYLKEPNATRAAIAAGYSERSAHDAGCRLLKIPEIAEFISIRTSEALENLEVTAESVVDEVGRLAFDPHLKPSDRLRALELLMKRFGLLTDRIKHETEGDIRIRMLGLPDKTRGDGSANNNG
jgi:phage terminase small subunit